MRDEDIAKLDRRGAVLLDLPAGSIHIHHYRLIHWSAPNTSPGERRLLINSYAAADAVNLASDSTKLSALRPPRARHMARGRAPHRRRHADAARLQPGLQLHLRSPGRGRRRREDVARPAGAARTGVRRSVGRAAWPPRQPGRGSLAPHPPPGARSVGSRGVGDSLAPPRLNDVAARLATRRARRTCVPRPAPRRRVELHCRSVLSFSMHPRVIPLGGPGRSGRRRSQDVGNGRRRVGSGWRVSRARLVASRAARVLLAAGRASHQRFDCPPTEPPQGDGGPSEPRLHATGEPRGAPEGPAYPGPPGAGG